jgi:hypothetical protein
MPILCDATDRVHERSPPLDDDRSTRAGTRASQAWDVRG